MLLLTLLSCSNKSGDVYIPPISEGMADGIYMKYKLKLDTAYLNKDDFEIGIQLANLKGSANSVYNRLNKGIKADPKNCYRIYDWYDGYQNDFLNNIVKTDTAKFIQSFTLCEQLNEKESYSEYWTRKTIEYQERIAKREPIDSSKLNLKLIKLLDDIRKDDQETRIEISKQRIEDFKHPLWLKQKRLDSINLDKINLILQNGFPSRDEVGYDKVGTIWLVLHHQGDLNTRMKYLPILEEAQKDGKLGKGALETYKWRNNNIKLNKK
jgi:hypothetical protein